jgi:hypothetical protein
MRCHSVACGTPKLEMPSITRSSTAVHMNAVIRVYDDAGNMIETHEHKGDFKEW